MLVPAPRAQPPRSLCSASLPLCCPPGCGPGGPGPQKLSIRRSGRNPCASVQRWVGENPQAWHSGISRARQPEVFCFVFFFWSISGENSEQAAALRVSQGGDCLKRSLTFSRVDSERVPMVLCLEALPPSEGGVHRLSQDGLPSGEAGSAPARLSQKLFPLPPL